MTRDHLLRVRLSALAGSAVHRMIAANGSSRSETFNRCKRSARPARSTSQPSAAHHATIHCIQVAINRIPAPVVEDGLSLTAVTARTKKLQESVAVLKRVPIPSPDIRQKVQSYVRGLTWPVVEGIALGEALTVQWPRDLHALMAFLQPEVLVERLMAEINRIANTSCPLAEREQRIAELEHEVDRLQRTEEAIVVATGAPRERGCPPWVVLGVKAVEARGTRVV
jgi:hypothetical protein